jgi:transcriptional regulator with XRE-family HTH domain
MKRAADDNDKLIGRNIRLARNFRGMSAAKLGKLLGISYQQIQKYEYGKNRISALKLNLIANSLFFPIDFFFAPDSEEVIDILRERSHGS